MCTPEDSRSGASGRLRGRVTIGSRPAAHVIGVTFCCEEVFVSTNLGEFEIALTEGAHELRLLGRDAMPAYLDFVIERGSVLTLPPIDLIPDSVLKDLDEGDRCPVHAGMVLRYVMLPVEYGLPGGPPSYRDRSGRFPFPGNMAWGGCRPRAERMVQVLRCDACSAGDRELFEWARRQPD